MATKKSDARWWLADVVMEFVIEGEPRNVVHVNTHLIEASKAEEAYRKALTIGRAGRMTYRNPYGRRVRVRFRGLEQLQDIAESLADGAELRFRQLVGVPEQAIKQRVRAKRRLFVFSPITEDRTVPNYMDASIVDELVREGFSRQMMLDAAAPPTQPRGRSTTRPLTRRPPTRRRSR